MLQPLAADPGKGVAAPSKERSQRWSATRPDGHAPMGVMFDHMHGQGEFMVGFRFMRQKFEGLASGSSSLSHSAAFDLGYTALPTEMTMSMFMLDLMYAPTDRLSLMLMPQYVDMEMEMIGMHGGHDEHGMHSAHGDHHGRMSTHRHSVSGPGDTLIGAMIKLADFNRHLIHLTLGLSIPTGSVDEKSNGVFTHYGMQPGSGTWDFRPTLTYLGQTDSFSWGVQAGGIARLQEANESGFSFGDVFESSVWAAWQFADWASISLRLGYRSEGDIEGHYNGPHNHSSPPDLQSNYGGESLLGGLGLNIRVPGGPLKGHRLGVELVMPLWQDLNGVQLEQDLAITAAWQYSF